MACLTRQRAPDGAAASIQGCDMDDYGEYNISDDDIPPISRAGGGVVGSRMLVGRSGWLGVGEGHCGVQT